VGKVEAQPRRSALNKEAQKRRWNIHVCGRGEKPALAGARNGDGVGAAHGLEAVACWTTPTKVYSSYEHEAVYYVFRGSSAEEPWRVAGKNRHSGYKKK